MSDGPAGEPSRALGAIVELARWWWLYLLRGAVSVAFGVSAFLWPTMTAVALAFLVAAWAIVDGGASLVASLRVGQRGREAFIVAIEGLLGFVAGVVVLAWPRPTLIVLALLVGVWAIIRGVLEIMAAHRLRRAIPGAWLLAAGGAASVLAGVALVRVPVAGIVGLTLVLAAYAIVFGVAHVGLGIRLWRAHAGGAMARTA